ncbi:hypothetical protein ACWCXE_27050 [Streptomyces sp. NPDC001780]
MNLTVIQQWATAHPWTTIGILAALLAATATAVYLAVRQLTGPVAAAALGALVCTAYSGDTSWNFARDHLGMTDTTERLVMFAAGEVALLACAVMARANKRATATATADGGTGSPGTPGVLVWVITGVQVIPAYSESGIVGGTVRAVIGPVMAGLLWHLAMGLEIRVGRPGALSTGLPALIAREARERLLSYLGLARRDRTAEQISRDRATARAVRLASRSWRGPWARRRLAAAVARSGAATDEAQRERLMAELAARRSADDLATVEIASPWQPAPVPGPGYAAEIERVPVPDPAAEPYPQIEAPRPPVLDVVPAGTRTLPIVARPAPAPPAGTTAAEYPRTRSIVHAEYVPEYPYPLDPTAAEHPQPEDEPAADDDGQDEPDPDEGCDIPDPDPLLERARADFGTDVPGIARLKRMYGIGQARAQRIRDALTGVPA